MIFHKLYYIKEWHVGVRVQKTGKLVAFIAGTPVKLMVKERNVKAATINYLCVLKKLRSKRLAPILVREVTRRINLCNVWQAAYTAGIVIPRPVATTTYYHRALNTKKLIEADFSALPMGETMAAHLKKNRPPKIEDVVINGFPRDMQKKDIVAVYKLLKNYLEQFKLRPKYDQETVSHLLLPKNGIIYSYVVENPETNEITDFISFFRIPNQILEQNPYQHTSIDVSINKGLILI